MLTCLCAVIRQHHRLNSVILTFVLAVKPGGALVKKAMENLQRRRTGRRGRTMRKEGAGKGPTLAPAVPTQAVAGTPEGPRCALFLLGQPLPDFVTPHCAWTAPPPTVQLASSH